MAQCLIYLSGMTNEILAKYEALALNNSLSLIELCAKADVAQSTVSRWRSGRKPQGRTLRKLDSALAKLGAQ
jgi:transcriptional regulator with XRE-family HTH domain